MKDGLKIDFMGSKAKTLAPNWVMTAASRKAPDIIFIECVPCRKKGMPIELRTIEKQYAFYTWKTRSFADNKEIEAYFHEHKEQVLMAWINMYTRESFMYVTD